MTTWSLEDDDDIMTMSEKKSADCLNQVVSNRDPKVNHSLRIARNPKHQQNVISSINGPAVHNEISRVGRDDEYFLDSRYATAFFGVVISANAILIGIEVDMHDNIPFGLIGTFLVIEHAFVAIYLFESIARLWQHGRGFFKQPPLLLDLSIVVLSVIDAWILTPLGNSANLNLLKLLRLVRLFRILRIIRLMRVFSELMSVVRALILSLPVLCWTFALVLFITYLYALVFKIVLDALSSTRSATVEQYFSSNWGTSLSLFQILTGSNAHENIIRPLLGDSPYPVVLYMLIQLYVIVVRFGLLTSSVAVIVLNVDANERKREKEKLDMIDFLSKINFFTKIFLADKITLEMFETAFNDARAFPRLRALDIHWMDPLFLFHVIDGARKGYITKSEISKYLVRMKEGVPLLAMKVISDRLEEISHCVSRIELWAKDRRSYKELKAELESLMVRFELELERSTDPVVKKRQLGLITKL